MMARSTRQPDAFHTVPRLFVPAPLSAGADIAASPEQAHYLGVVLRRASGDPVRLFNGGDGEWLARLAYARRDRLSFVVDHQIRPQRAETGPWLVFSLLKRDATDLVVRQAVEMGVSRIVPVVTERCNATRVNEARLRAIAIEAAEQSERLTIPPVAAVADLTAVLADWPADRLLFAAIERSRNEPPPRPAPTATPYALMIGPEGGFTAAERDRFERLDFVSPISLGPYVLRAETAAVAGLAQLPGLGWAEYVPNQPETPE